MLFLVFTNFFLQIGKIYCPFIVLPHQKPSEKLLNTDIF
jgi:hypothetical protein